MRISVSKLKLFKACRRAYQLRYCEGLVPEHESDALQIGKSYHAKIEQLYNEQDFDASDLSKESAMATAYKQFIYPQCSTVLPEIWFDVPIGHGDNFVGRIDGWTSDKTLVEHKTTSSEIADAYEYRLLWDDQIPAYMFATGAREVIYTVCRKPTIRQKQGESDEEFFQRMCDWYSTDTDTKIRTLDLYRTDDEVQTFAKHLTRMVDEIKNTTYFYRNASHCMTYGRQCEYAPICLNYDPEQQYIGFVKKEEYDEYTKDE